MDPVWSGRKDDGPNPTWFVLDDFEGFMLYLGRWAPGEPMELVVRKPRKPSSDPQRRYYYGVVMEMLSEETGHTKEELDWYFKCKLLGTKNTDGIWSVPSKNDLTTVQMNEYIEAIRTWACLKLNLNIPGPNEVDYGGKEIDEDDGGDNAGH
jgi:hypothetical protein